MKTPYMTAVTTVAALCIISLLYAHVSFRPKVMTSSGRQSMNAEDYIKAHFTSKTGGKDTHNVEEKFIEDHHILSRANSQQNSEANQSSAETPTNNINLTLDAVPQDKQTNEDTADSTSLVQEIQPKEATVLYNDSAPRADRVSRREDPIPGTLEDEDNYELTEIGFPNKPLTIEEARLCDRQEQTWLKGSMYRCQDPTCMKCARHDAPRKEEIIKAFKEESFLKERMALYQKHFKPKQPVTVMSVNKGQIHLWLNWVCSCEKNGIPVRNSTLMVPTDDVAAKVIEKNNFLSLNLKWLSSLSFKIDAEFEGADKSGWNPHMQGHSDINSVTIIVANEIIQLNYTLLLHDVDIVWKRDPRHWLTEAAVHRDALAMFAPRWDALGVANSGFMWITPSRRTRIFMQTLENLLPIKGISDQQLWNAALRHYKFRQITFRVLPLKQFQLLYDHTLRRWKSLKDDAIVVHGVSHRKTYRLASAKLWYFDESCSAFEPSFVPCNGEFFKASCKV
mmetsp:Transcript_4/g.7  ORF Transcript_4/g.7 Transcript_4/m.7 type:complete len:507 (+) Transcript_4:140-1660(+)|eukprot:CAMPEP_0167757668 /NCGR_PEP_ID=MMETSP0110_2-20121227/10051_1 /TAXON_ID=629695 /ORGANISM="Gymnochlora sp., Strain CCMP2014" /LENGTH=506 /DNA_ID=CAMNT_0007643879 /DNA_START=101 /DNA_END=1621 /DNA_ORIENTATION=-